MMKVVIVDDELDSLELISSLINIFYPNAFKVVGKAQNVIDAKQIIDTQKPDLLFLDIEMPGGTGFDLLRTIETKELAIIFITGYNQYAIDTFKFNTLDYILKPISPSEFKKGLEKALNNKKTALSALIQQLPLSKNKQNKIALPTPNGIEFLSVNDIAYCAADNKYTLVYNHANLSSLIAKSIGEFEELLRNFDFFRVHKSYLVNKDYIVRYNKNDNLLELNNEIFLPVSTRKKDEFLAWILTEII